MRAAARHPDPVRAAKLAAAAGADGITAHLREDRRHISDGDIDRLVQEIDLPLNLEMAATDEMLAIALAHKPHAACIVPEKREERTTEGGIDAAGQHNKLAPFVRALSDAKVRVSLFVEANKAQLDAAKSLGAPVVELHTGAYCDSEGAARDRASRGHSRGGGLWRFARASKSMPATASASTRSGPSRRFPKFANSISATS